MVITDGNNMRHCILQVDDDENDVTLMREAFSQLRITDVLQVVRNGQAAIDYFRGVGPYADRNTYPLPSVVILDLALPMKNGFEVLAWIREQRELRTLPVIVFTSMLRSDDVEKACLLGANSCVNKPSGLAELLRFVLFLEGWWLQCNVTPQRIQVAAGL